MMSTTNKIFLDSSIFIEASKGFHLEFLRTLTKAGKYECFISDIVCSEAWYLFIGLNGGASPLALKGRKAIKSLVMAHDELFSFYRQYNFLSNSIESLLKAHELMAQYNLLPNDAIILSTCKFYQIPLLASHDSDFEIAYAGEGIQFITPQNYLEKLADN